MWEQHQNSLTVSTLRRFLMFWNFIHIMIFITALTQQRDAYFCLTHSLFNLHQTDTLLHTYIHFNVKCQMLKRDKVTNMSQVWAVKSWVKYHVRWHKEHQHVFVTLKLYMVETFKDDTNTDVCICLVLTQATTYCLPHRPHLMHHVLLYNYSKIVYKD